MLADLIRAAVGEAADEPLLEVPSNTARERTWTLLGSEGSGKFSPGCKKMHLEPVFYYVQVLSVGPGEYGTGANLQGGDLFGKY